MEPGGLDHGLEDRFELLERLGGGTDTVVRRARERGSAGRIVALKHLRPLADREAADALRAEAVVAGLVRHPNLLPVNDYIAGPALVLPYVATGDLGRRLETGALPPRDAVRVVLGIAAALEALHATGIVHRDVSPANVLLAADGRALLCDLGEAVGPHRWPEPGVAVGTPEYLAPEVAGGGAPTPAADQYSLGVLAYELLTGTPPYRGASPLATLRLAGRGEHAPLNRPSVPGDLAAAVERAMHLDPDRRHDDIASFAAAVERLAPALAVAPIPSASSPVVDVVPPVARPLPRRWVVALAAAALYAIPAGVGFVLA